MTANQSQDPRGGCQRGQSCSFTSNHKNNKSIHNYGRQKIRVGEAFLTRTPPIMGDCKVFTLFFSLGVLKSHWLVEKDKSKSNMNSITYPDHVYRCDIIYLIYTIKKWIKNNRSLRRIRKNIKLSFNPYSLNIPNK